jgi:anti-sigma-K factor RskA
MNIQAYIESGIIEEYVLGTVSPQEKQEVECMSHIYPEIKAELLRTEDALEQYALKYQTPPPASLKESLFAQMNFDESPERVEESTVQVAATSEDIIPLVENQNITKENEVPKVIDGVFDSKETKVITPVWARFAVAASVLLALFAGWSALESSGLKSQLASLQGDNQELAFQMESVKKLYSYKESLAGLYRSSDYKLVKLTGIPAKSPESLVAAFWNQQTNEVMLDVQKLPPAPAGKQYQLWSIVNGVPVDNGMLDDNFQGKVLKMKPTKSGSAAFAITLEKTGGSPTPTMQEMYVMGNV